MQGGRAESPASRTTDLWEEKVMRISAENVLRGTITQITEGATTGLVKLNVNDMTITANISMHAIHDLNLQVGTPAVAIIKADDVMIAPEEPKYVISARNQLPGSVAGLEKGAVNALVLIEVDGLTIVSSTTWAAVQEMDLQPGMQVTAVIKATAVMIAVEQ